MNTYYNQMGLEEGQGVRKESSCSELNSNEQITKFIQIGNEVLELLEIKQGKNYKVINLITLENDEITSVIDIAYPINAKSFQTAARNYLKQSEGFTRTVYIKEKITQFQKKSLDQQFENVKPNW